MSKYIIQRKKEKDEENDGLVDYTTETYYLC